MELPHRAGGDVLLKSGELTAIRSRLRAAAGRHDLASVVACAYDHRTRMLPFSYATVRMVPAGVRAVGAALVDSGFAKTRIVLQQWNRNVRPSRMRLDGRAPDMLLVSSMRIHSDPCRELIRDACRIEPDRRPLIIAGGPLVIYEPWDVFGTDRDDPWGADVAVTGEEYVLLHLLEVLLSVRAAGEPMRSAFARARASGALDEVPGLVYPVTDGAGRIEELVDTGIQRLAGDLDELPHAAMGYALLEPPSRAETLSPAPLPPSGVERCSPIGSLVMTVGCRFGCPYCPIPAYNQRQFRAKSGPRIADEMRRIHDEYGIGYFFGADDNFFNDPDRVVEIAEHLARAEIQGVRFRRKVRWGTEVTVHDTLRMRDHLPLVRRAGLRALWLGVEDMTATLVRKGQSVDSTREAFALLRQVGIATIAMMMHHDGQPLYTRGRPYGLLNQVRLLQKWGAVDVQVLMITPATGSRTYEESYTSGQVFGRAAGRRIEPRMFDGNYVVASGEDRPWRKQLNLLAAYVWMYNPLQVVIALIRPNSDLYLLRAAMTLTAIAGLVQTVRRTLGWALRLWRGPIERRTRAPVSPIPMRSPDGAPAAHATPGTPVARRAPAEAAE